jgi:tripartite-type tricarboxylate transporter receptor subunit TctC
MGSVRHQALGRHRINSDPRIRIALREREKFYPFYLIICRKEGIIMKEKLICLLLVIGSLLGIGITNEVLGKEKEFPSKPIELICHMGAGGSTSMGGRIVAGTLSEFLGTPVVVINKTGGGGSVAATYAARSKPDGYTLFIFNSGPNGATPAMRSVDYKNTDFELIALYGTQPLVLGVKSDAPWKTLGELVEEAKKNPGKLKFSTPGIGTSSHFMMELFKITAGGLKIAHVPYKSGPESLAAVLGGHVQINSSFVVDIKGAVDAGRLRVLAVAEEKRLEDYPDIPTFSELGYPEVKLTAWYGIAAPIGVPKEVSDKLKDALYKTIKHPEVKKMLTNVGFTPVFKDAEEFTKFVREEENKFHRIAKEAGIKME